MTTAIYYPAIYEWFTLRDIPKELKNYYKHTDLADLFRDYLNADVNDVVNKKQIYELAVYDLITHATDDTGYTIQAIEKSLCLYLGIEMTDIYHIKARIRLNKDSITEQSN